MPRLTCAHDSSESLPLSSFMATLISALAPRASEAVYVPVDGCASGVSRRRESHAKTHCAKPGCGSREEGP